MAGGEGLLKLIITNKEVQAATDWLTNEDGEDIFSRNPLKVEHENNIDTMSFDLAMWDARNKSVVAYVERRGVRLLKRLTGEYFRTIVRYTPYDTGNAIRHWYILSDGDVPEYTDMRDEPIERGDAIDEAMDRGEEALADLKRNSKPMVINTAPYIESLDVGSSKKAPAGMSVHAEAAVIAVWDSFHSGNKDILKENPLAGVELGSRSTK